MKRLLRRLGGEKQYASRFLAVLALLLAMDVSVAAAADWYVDSTLGMDTNSCMASGLAACQTIQAAINKASPNDTIHVAAGVYLENTSPGQPLKIDKTLT